ncbi:MAG TPA: DUF4440 domain-containing protein [Vicinamibacterales bacterium]|nr:DUF4440 domain-containing protein [Vicinamibacterales bacterium]
MLLFLIALLSTAVAPPSDGGCDRPEFHALDFWIGEWTVVAASGEPVGTNRIEKILNGCAVQENWTEPSGEEGKSLFYYSPSEHRWKQVWITDSATVLGGMKEKRALPVVGAGIRFQGELVDRDRVVLDRTTLTPLGDGRVHQLIETSSDGGTTWKVQFDAMYERKSRVISVAANTPVLTCSGTCTPGGPTVVLEAGAGNGAETSAALSASDTAAVRAATLAYRDAWLANDASRVMATLTEDAVLLPSGLAPIQGSAAIRDFWWPAAAPATTVIAMELTIGGIDGSGNVAIVTGRGTLTFTTGGASAPRSLASTFINVLRRQPSGAWLIAERMWSDLR